jgi:hypothetical protein
VGERDGVGSERVLLGPAMHLRRRWQSGQRPNVLQDERQLQLVQELVRNTFVAFHRLTYHTRAHTHRIDIMCYFNSACWDKIIIFVVFVVGLLCCCSCCCVCLKSKHGRAVCAVPLAYNMVLTIGMGLRERWVAVWFPRRAALKECVALRAYR